MENKNEAIKKIYENQTKCLTELVATHGMLMSMVLNLTRENEALLDALQEYADCDDCKFGKAEIPIECIESCGECRLDCPCAGCADGHRKWAWKGAPEGEPLSKMLQDVYDKA